MIHLTGHKSAVRGLAYSPDGLTLASASMDSTVRLWDTRTASQERVLQTQFPGAICVNFSRTGDLLASGHRGGHVLIWKLNRLDYPYPGGDSNHIHECGTVLFDSRDRFLFSRSHYIAKDRVSRYDHVTTWFEGRSNDLTVVAMDLGHDDQLAFLTQSGEIWSGSAERNGESKPLIRGFIEGGRGDLKCRPRSDGLAMTSGNFIGLWSGRKNELPRTWRAHNAEVSQLAFLPDGSGLLSAGLDGTVRSWDLDSLSERAAFDFGIGECFSIAVAPDGLTAAVGGLTDIVLWDLTD